MTDRPAVTASENTHKDSACTECSRLASRVEELEATIRYALGAAGGRWEEWGERAMTVKEILDLGLAGAHAEEKE